jgi:hypothetical protein
MKFRANFQFFLILEKEVRVYSLVFSLPGDGSMLAETCWR